MKVCKNCGMQTDDQAVFCPTCQSTEFSVADDRSASVYAPTEQSAVIDDEVDKGHGNILAGVVGAFLFSLVGGALYFLIYQMGMLAGICGLVTFILANFGYGFFAKNKDKHSLVALIVSIVVTVITIFLAEYLCLSYEILQASKEEGWTITFFEAVQLTPDFLALEDVRSAVLKDLGFSYVFGFIACVGNIRNTLKARKQK